MNQQITWTHVDQLVRRMHEDRGLLPLGLTDAEVAHSFIKWLQAENETLRRGGEAQEKRADWAENALKALQSKPTGKTKKRLTALEAKVEELVAWTGLER